MTTQPEPDHQTEPDDDQSIVEIGGQRMTQAQYDAATFPLLSTCPAIADGDEPATKHHAQEDHQPAWAHAGIIDLLADIRSLADMVPRMDRHDFASEAARLIQTAGLVIAPDPEVRIEHYRDTTGDYRWRAVDTHNGLTIADSAEGYRTKTHAHHMANRLFPTAHVTEV